MRRFLCIFPLLVAAAWGDQLLYNNAASLGHATGTTFSASYTVGTGPHRAALFYLIRNVNAEPTCTYNGVSTTLIASATATHYMYVFLLLDPASGANTLACSSGTSGYFAAGAVDYSSVAQTYTVASHVDTTTANDLKGIVTTTVDRSWVVMFADTTTVGTPSLTGGTQRAALDYDNARVYDSNGPITPPGATQIEINGTTSANVTGITVALAPYMPTGMVADGWAQSGDGSAVTLTGKNTTGANLIILLAASGGSGGTLTDCLDFPTCSQHNTYTPLTNYGAGGKYVRLYYVFSPSTSTTHQWTFSGSVPCLAMQAWSGVGAYTTHENGNANGSTTSLQPGSITPGGAGELLVTGAAFSYYATSYHASIDSGFTISDQPSTSVSGKAGDCGMAYLFAPNTSAVDPTWNTGSTAGMATAIASFSMSAAPAAARHRIF